MPRGRIEDKVNQDQLTSMPVPQGDGRRPKPSDEPLDDDTPELDDGNGADDGDGEYDGETGDEKYGARR